jgi:Putative lumazine-binding
MTANKSALESGVDTADRAAIRAVIQTYLDGLYEGDADKLAAAFHPTSALAQSTDGNLQVTPRDTWLAAVRTRPSPKSQGFARGDEILALDIIGPTMAYVRLRCQIPPRYFTDQLSLLKIDNRWQIAQKVFQTETR